MKQSHLIVFVTRSPMKAGLFKYIEMTFHEKTTTIVNYRGKIKAAQIGNIALRIGYTLAQANEFWEGLRNIPGSPKAATIWFESGSYAYWDNAGYWDFVAVPEISEELKPASKIRAEKVNDSVYSIWFEKLEIGKAVREVDGYFYFDPYGRKSLWSDYSLRWIADCITELNRPWDEQIKRYLG
jgi:hypothetical protein